MNRELDEIHIRELFLRCVIGVNEDERNKRQDIMVNIILGADLSAAFASDDINDTVDYTYLRDQLVKIVESSSFFLIETLASRIADICLESALVQRVEVTVDKPGALRFSKSVAVRVVRFKNADLNG